MDAQKTLRIKRIFYELMGWYWKTEQQPTCTHEWGGKVYTSQDIWYIQCKKCSLRKNIVLASEKVVQQHG